MGVRDWTKARKRDHTRCPKRRSRIRCQSNMGTSRAEVFAREHRARQQPYLSPLLRCLSTPNLPTSASDSEVRLILKPAVTQVELGNLAPVSGVLLVTEVHR